VVLLLACGLICGVAPAPASPHAAPSSTGSVRALRLHTRTSSRLALTWRRLRGERSFQVRARVAREHWRVAAHPRRASATLSGLRSSTTYAVEVRGCKRGACGAWSRPLSVRTLRASQAATPVAGTNGVSDGGSGGCQIFPADNAWHEDVSQLPVDPRSSAYIASIGAADNLHPDFGSETQYGIPYTLVGPHQPLVPINFTAYGDQSNPGPYPVPANAPVEGGPGASGDRHVLVLQSGACRLFELDNASLQPNGSWNADSGAVFNLSSDALRPDGWTSADAAGLSIFAGLIRYDEIQAGVIDHAIRMTVPRTQAGFMHPATHETGNSTDPNLPPMGLRLRLKASFDISSFPATDQIILTAMKRYGMIVADNGSPWYFQGTSDPRWSDDTLDALKSVPGSAFEVVETGAIQHVG
jgi:hypothetical protein